MPNTREFSGVTQVVAPPTQDKPIHMVWTHSCPQCGERLQREMATEDVYCTCGYRWPGQ